MWSKSHPVIVLIPALLSLACNTADLATLRLIPPALLDAPRWIVIDKDLTYAEHDARPLLFDLYRPALVTNRLPLVIIIHGGSWSGGQRGDMAEFAYDVAAQGYAV